MCACGEALANEASGLVHCAPDALSSVLLRPAMDVEQAHGGHQETGNHDQSPDGIHAPCHTLFQRSAPRLRGHLFSGDSGPVEEVPNQRQAIEIV